jgi:hypothetical protein
LFIYRIADERAVSRITQFLPPLIGLSSFRWDWPPRAVTMRVFDLDQGEVHSGQRQSENVRRNPPQV